MNIPDITLNNGVPMPALGYGVFRIPNREAARCVADAVAAGYRSIDTAMIYGNERGTAEGIRASGVPREQLFIATKVWNSDQGYEATLKAFEQSRRELGLSYLDLYLIHWPVPQKGLYRDTWRALEKLYREDAIRAIGVSNFTPAHLDDLISHSEIVPAVDQVELHPWFGQKELRASLKARGIAVEAWGPLAQGNHTVSEVLDAIAQKYAKTIQQVMLRWHFQNGVIAIPKSVRAERMASNLAIFDFELTPADMASIDGLDVGERLGPHPDTFEG